VSVACPTPALDPMTGQEVSPIRSFFGGNVMLHCITPEIVPSEEHIGDLSAAVYKTELVDIEHFVSGETFEEATKDYSIYLGAKIDNAADLKRCTKGLVASITVRGQKVSFENFFATAVKF
jgi:hypothetical protein